MVPSSSPRIAALAVALLLVAGSVAAGNARAADGAGRALQFTLGTGGTRPNLAGLAHWIERERLVTTGSTSDDWPRTGLDQMWEVGVGARVSPRWSVGVAAERNWGGSESITIAFPHYLFTESHTRFSEMGVEVAYWPVMPAGLHIGGRAGRGEGRVSFEATHEDLAVFQSATTNGTWSASALTGGAFVGWHSPVRKNPIVEVRAGWNWRDLGTPTNASYTLRGAAARGALRDVDGRAVSFDFSGPTLKLAIGYAMDPTRWAWAGTSERPASDRPRRAPH